MRIIKYNRGKKADNTNSTTIPEQLTMQISSLSNKLDSYFTLNEDGVLVSNYDIASTGQITSEFAEASVKIYDAEVEYLESTGTQYINTGISQNSNYIIEVEVMASAYGVEGLVGARVSRISYDHSLVFPTDAQQLRYSLGNQKIFANFTLNEWHTVITNGSVWYIDDVQQTNVNYTTPFNNDNLTYYLFAINTNGTVSNYNSSVKVRRCKIRNGDTVLVDLIPVRVGQVGQMYDQISKRLFGNSGTGNFVFGNDV